jgi:hypothetical protein
MKGEAQRLDVAVGHIVKSEKGGDVALGGGGGMTGDPALPVIG